MKIKAGIKAAELRALLDQASPLPWFANDTHIAIEGEIAAHADCVSPDDAGAIVAVMNLAPLMVEILEILEEEDPAVEEDEEEEDEES